MLEVMEVDPSCEISQVKDYPGLSDFQARFQVILGKGWS